MVGELHNVVEGCQCHTPALFMALTIQNIQPKGMTPNSQTGINTAFLLEGNNIKLRNEASQFEMDHTIWLPTLV